MPPQMVHQISEFFKGLKRKAAKDRQSGQLDIASGTGKVPLPIMLYKELCLAFLKRGDTTGVFCHAYATLSWNLVCRTFNTKAIKFSHLSWLQDAIGVQFGFTKSDQCTRHV